MAQNITFDGYNFDKNGSLGSTDVYYQGFFYQNGTVSSPSKWNEVRSLEETGYYNINLGDTDWLGQESLALPGSIVVIVFWKGNIDRTSSCDNLLEWGAFEIELTNSEFYTYDTQTKDNILPNLIWSHNLPESPIVGESYTINNNSDDIHSWEFDGIETPSTITMNHWYVRYGQIINGPNIVSHTNIYWGDGTADIGIVGAGGASHVWTSSGNYEVLIEIYDDCGGVVSDTQTFNVEWDQPVPDIVMIPSNPLPNEPVSFIYTGTDPDDRIISIDWIIEDSGLYGNTNTVISGEKNETINHSSGLGTNWYEQPAISGAFTNPGNHTVSIVINWNDGFNDRIVNYSEVFLQRKFIGPNLSFTQLPANATVGSGVKFVNTSTDTGMVGLGLPDHSEYDWNWFDDGLTDAVLDKQYTYEFEKTPLSTNCSVELCASWTDGWDSLVTCISQDVVFGTSVTIVPEDCYYRIEVIGTSSDGSISGYSWTISSGITNTGPWTEVWQSPIGMEQQSKTICFTATGWYKIEGFVYGTGTTTSAYQTWYIDETCPDTSSTYIIWNGTGVLDLGADWQHSGKGYESEIAMYRGTNGLLVSNSETEDAVLFTRQGNLEIDINNYDFLTFWIKVNNWTKYSDVSIKLHSNLMPSPANVHTVKLSNYIIFEGLDNWQKVMIPLKRFRLPQNKNKVGWPTLVNELKYTINGQVDFWLDNVSLVIGKMITVAVCGPEMETYKDSEQYRPPNLIVDDMEFPDMYVNLKTEDEDVDLVPNLVPNTSVGTPTIRGKGIKLPYPRPIDS